GHSDLNSNLIQLLNLRSQDKITLKQWLQIEKKFKWLAHDVQNEILRIMAHNVLRAIVADVTEVTFFSIVVDETVDILQNEQLSLCLRYVNNALESCEDFAGFYGVECTNSEMFFSVLNNALPRLRISYHGNCYDGAANMSGCVSGLQTHVKESQGQAHSLNRLKMRLKCVPACRDVLNLIKQITQEIVMD
ncbi:UNVERIFIED_CONTAM: hypothetical protein FKN15_015603, partial [Acipenser sinensis]